MAASLVFHEKIIQGDGSIVEMKIWRVSKTAKYPEGYRYSLFLVKEGKVLVGYDNHHPKGHHRHHGDKQEPYLFMNIEKLVHDFSEDRKRMSHEG